MNYFNCTVWNNLTYLLTYIHAIKSQVVFNRFEHRASDIGNIGTFSDIGKSRMSSC